MSLTKERIHYLLKAYTSKQASAAEESELMNWILDAGEDSELKSYVLDIWNQNKPLEEFSYVDWNTIYSRVVHSPVVSIKPNIWRKRWRQFAAAAVILIVLSAGIYSYFSAHSPLPIATKEPGQNDIAPPAGNKAILTLADGTRIELDSTGNGTLAVQGNVRIIKKSSGEIRYSGAAAGVATYNTLSVPRGCSPISLLLSDGSKVWINVGSSLTYPTAFPANERIVKMTGEAYFEVVHNEKMPFVLQNGDLKIRDLGTHFNVNTYEDEPAAQITLLEGSVRISTNTRSQLLKPGQQANINHNEHDDAIKVSNDVDMAEVVAWKDGKFKFDKNADIGTIMRQISRWYNVDVEYKGIISQRFWGSISKDVNVSQVFKILEATGGVKFKIDGKKIIVMPASH